jgi:hypothetical protein
VTELGFECKCAGDDRPDGETGNEGPAHNGDDGV